MRKRQRLPAPPTNIITVIASTLAVFFILAFGGKALEAYRLQRHNALLRKEIAALEEQQQQLPARLEYVKSPEYVEKVAREQYKWTKPGQTLIIPIFRRRPIAVASPTPLSQSTAETTTSTPSTSHWSEWWNLLASSLD